MEPDTLRIVLFLIGITVIFGIVALDRYKKRNKEDDQTNSENAEERLEVFTDTQNDDETPIHLDGLIANRCSDTMTKTLGSEMMNSMPSISTQDNQSIPDSTYAKPQPSEKIIAFSILAATDTMFTGKEIRAAAQKFNFVYGDMNIFNRCVEVNGKQQVLFSLVNVLEPGYFDLDTLDRLRTPGVTLFMRLPGPQDGLAAFSDMLFTAHQLVATLHGHLCGQNRKPIGKQDIDQLRQGILEFCLINQENT